MDSQKVLLTRSSILILGLTAISTQIVLIRETLAIFQGNELIIGIFMGIWMMMTAIGSYIISKIPSSRQPPPGLPHPGEENLVSPHPRSPASLRPHFPASLLLLFSVLPLSAIFILYYADSALVPAGVTAGLGQATLVIILSTAPFCLVSGMLFPLLVRELSALKEKNLLYEGYALDSGGSIIGGLLFSLVIIFILTPFESLLMLTFICLALLLTGTWMKNRKAAAIVLLTGIVVLAGAIVLKPDRLFNALPFKNQEVLETRESPFGKLAVTRIGEQVNVYENGVPVMTGNDPIYREESVQYAMLLHPSPENILLISGGAAGTIEEILKYPVKSIDYLEINPWMIRLIARYKAFPSDSRIRYIYKDPRIFIGKSGKKYDVIILNTPEPASAELNRFYTREFFQLLKERLEPGGIISFSISAAGNYMNETSRMMHSVCYRTLQAVFPFTRIIPGWKDYYLASDTPLDRSFFDGYKSRGFTNTYVNPSYINEDLLKMRTGLIMKDLLKEAPVNSDLKPYAFSLTLRHWMERFKIDERILPVSLAVLIVLGFLFLGPLNLGLFAGGFTASALEFLLLIWFQVIYGYLYQMTGIIFAVFMAGLVIGSLLSGNRYWLLGSGYSLLGNRIKKFTFSGFLIIQGVMAIFSALVSLIFLLFSSSPSLPISQSPSLPISQSPSLPISQSPSLPVSWSLILLILFLVLIAGFLMGIQFSLSAHLRKQDILKSSGEAFSADLLGSAIGIVLVSVYLVPRLGLPLTGLVLASFNIFTLALIYIKRR